MTYQFQIVGNDTEEDRMLNDLMRYPLCKNFVKIGPDDFILTNGYNQELADKIKNYEVRNEDIFLAAYPKTGSTWLHEVVYLISNNLDYNKIAEMDQLYRLPCLEGAGIGDGTMLKDIISETHFDPEKFSQVLYSNENPRNIKTHLYFSLLPQQIRDGTKTPKIVVPLRNPYDVCVSFYHHSKLMYHYEGTFDQFCQLFMSGRVFFGHFWKHVKSYWEQKHRSNILFIKYSDLKRDFPSVIRKVAQFLEKEISDDDVTKLADYLSFENMRKNPHLNQENAVDNFFVKYNIATERSSFIRSGKEGGYKAAMSPEMIKKFDDWVAENTVGTDITF